MRKRFLWLILPIVAIAIAWIRLQPSQSGSTKAAHVQTVLDPRFSALQSELAQLKTEIHQLRWQRKIQAQKTVLAPTQNLQESQRPHTETINSTSESVQFENRIAALENRLFNESLDRDWAVETEVFVETAMDSVTFNGSTLASVSCRRTICKAEIVHDDDDTQTRFLNDFPEAISQSLPKGVFRRDTDDNDQTRTVLYLARVGFDFPPTELANTRSILADQSGDY